MINISKLFNMVAPIRARALQRTYIQSAPILGLAKKLTLLKQFL